MDGEGEELGQRKRVAPLSTVSLDSTYDQDGPAAIAKPTLRNRCSWAPFVVLAGLMLIAVGLVLALDRDNADQQEVVVGADERDPVSTVHSSLTSGEGLRAPKKKLVEWLNQTRNASELYVEGSSSTMSLTGVLFPRNGTDTSLPFDAMVAINSGVALPSRQYVALVNGRGFKWAVNSLGYGDSIVTNGCLTAKNSLPFDELDSVVSTANWTSSDPDDKSEVNVVFDEATYTVSKEEGDYYTSEMEDSHCWLIESEDEEFGLRVCTPVVGEQLPQMEFEELFNATTGCPQLAPNASRTATRAKFSVPLPLRKWYTSYKTQ